MSEEFGLSRDGQIDVGLVLGIAWQLESDWQVRHNESFVGHRCHERRHPFG